MGVGVGVRDFNDNAGGVSDGVGFADADGDGVGVGDSGGVGTPGGSSGDAGVADGDTEGVGDSIGGGDGGATSDIDSRVGINKLICADGATASIDGVLPRRYSATVSGFCFFSASAL